MTNLERLLLNAEVVRLEEEVKRLGRDLVLCRATCCGLRETGRALEAELERVTAAARRDAR